MKKKPSIHQPYGEKGHLIFSELCTSDSLENLPTSKNTSKNGILNGLVLRDIFTGKRPHILMGKIDGFPEIHFW